MKAVKDRGINYFKNFGICINRQPEQRETMLHTHNFKELVIVTKGKAVHFGKKDSYTIQRGDCFVVDEPHGYRNTLNFELTNILFVPEKLNIPWEEARKLPGYNVFFALEQEYRKKHNFRSIFRLSPDRLAVCMGIIDKIEKEIIGEKAGYEFISCSMFMELVAIISREYASSSRPDEETLMGVSKTISHLESNFDNQISFSSLINVSSLSESKLLREFRKVTGHTPIDYLLRLRISNAAKILRTERSTVTEVAFRCGFNDSNYFTRQFTKIMGISPRIYRSSKY